ncbi:MAG TPA: polymer-forming cytoskeletal protein [Pyrinomonadaceae bacterium]|nr:polymer-forming cytoskeletal protein [Pyrinomonadaceae bacterium]
MNTTSDEDGAPETFTPIDIAPATTFDPAKCFDGWFDAVRDMRSRREAKSLPAFYLENGEWEFDEQGNMAERFRSEGTLIVATHGKLEGNIEVGTAVIDGVFKGKITATENVVLENHALVIGEIHTQTLAIQGGAIIEGTCYFEAPKQERSGSPGWELLKVGLSRVWRGRGVQ